MKRDNINYTLTGVFVVSIGFALLIVLYFLTGRVSDADKYYTVLDDVSGINNGTAITYKGYKVGQLTEMRPVFKNNITRFELTLSVKSGWVIMQDSTIMITKTGMLSDSQLNIDEGHGSAVIAAGGYIESKPPNDVMAVVKSVSENINNISTGLLTPMIEQLKDDISVFSKSMRDDLPELTKNLNLLVTKLQKNSDVIDKVLNDSNQSKVSSFIKNADSMAKNLQLISQSIYILVDKNKSQVSDSVKNVNTTTRLLNDKLELILNQIELSSQNINDITRQIKNNPAVIIRNQSPTDSAIR